MRLIDADALKEKILTTTFTENNMQALNLLIGLIDDIPTDDAWISVKDMLPKKKGDYLIYNTDGTVWPYWYDADDNSWYDSCGYKTDIVTHWMPLPEPPKEDK